MFNQIVDSRGGGGGGVYIFHAIGNCRFGAVSVISNNSWVTHDG